MAPSPNWSANHDQTLEDVMESARPFLRGELERVDEKLPQLLSVLRRAGAGECWHKHGTFLDHLVDVYRILKMWNAPNTLCLCALFHSAYSNSYVNLAIFPPSSQGRDTVRAHVGTAAETLIHLFCVIPRHQLIHDYLLFQYKDDAQLISHLRSSTENNENDGSSNNWRAKLESVCPAEGMKVKHIKTGEDLVLPRRIVAAFLLLTMADFSDQLFGFQDKLFDNADGRLDFSGNKTATSLWPGDGKPGLWMNSVSRMGAIYRLIAREEEINNKNNVDGEYEYAEELVIPPVFKGCTAVVDSVEEMKARDLYWEVVSGDVEEMGLEKAEEMLSECVKKNPYVGEPVIVLGQIYLGKGEFEAAEMAAERGLRLMMEWGSPWDKRMTWQGWIAWGRVLLMKAKEKSWPNNPWAILNLGLVT